MIEVNACAEESARCPMDHVPVDVIRLEHHVPRQFSLNSYVKVLSLSRREVMRVNGPKGIGLLGKQDLRICSGSRKFSILLCPKRRKLCQERAISVSKRIKERGAE